jgi:hypothetical protein
LASVIVTVYTPDARPLIEDVVCPEFQRYVNVPVPPLAVTEAVPLFVPQEAGCVVTDATIAEGSDTTATRTLVHPLKSVTVTVYEPAASPEGS